MTECERIVAKGVVPQSFLEEETRSDFVVTVERKKIWTIELDLYFELKKICDKYGFKYFACYGTLLGLVRHQGFIPWDDDLDVLMPREDYDKFCLIASEELKSPYFFQTSLTENYWCNTARICNSNTTGIRQPLRGKEGVNKGIFIDILPLDKLSDNKVLRKLLFREIRIKTMIANAASLNVNKSKLAQFMHNVLNSKIVRFDYKKWYIHLNKRAAVNSNKKTTHVGLMMWCPYRYDKVVLDADDFSDSINMPFEFTEMPAPIGFKHNLEQIFGDYMKFPPVEERGKWHDILFAPDISYEDYYMKYGV